MDGKAPLEFIDSYTEERAFAADDNLLNSTRSTDFITPKSKQSPNLLPSGIHHRVSLQPVLRDRLSG